MNDRRSPEPTSEQLLASLDAELRSCREKRHSSRTTIRVGATLLIFALVVLALFFLALSMSEKAAARRGSSSADEPSGTKF